MMNLQQELNLALQHHRAGQLRLAESLYRQILAKDPNHAGALNYLGVMAAQLGRYDTAIELLRQAVAQDPGCAQAHYNLGNALSCTGQMSQAITAYGQAVAILPQFPEAHYNLANALTASGKLDQAIAAYRQAIAANPQFSEAHENLGNALRENGQSHEAITAYRKTIALKPNAPSTYNNLGNALTDAGQLADAANAYRQAIALDPQFPDAHHNLALALLLHGDYEQGLKEYEWRWKLKTFPSPPRNFPQPQWDGSDLHNRTLLLHAEQGFGDAIQFVRYVPMAAQRGGRILLECQPELTRLLQNNARDWQVVANGRPLSPFDVHCPLLSLPLIFATTLPTIPATVPYLHADPQLISKWQQRLAPCGSDLKVGLAWAGSPAHKYDKLRSPRQLSLFSPLAKLKGVQFISLQKGDTANQAATPPPGMRLIDWTADLTDFAETAALIFNLDLIISPDTAIAHLAGALAKPTWVMLPIAPDWRWLLDREDSPWYPTIRLFRQTQPLQWQDVVQRLTEALSEIIPGTSSSPSRG